MDKYKDPSRKMLSILLWGLIILFPLTVLAEETPSWSSKPPIRH